MYIICNLLKKIYSIQYQYLIIGYRYKHSKSLYPIQYRYLCTRVLIKIVNYYVSEPLLSHGRVSRLGWVVKDGSVDPGPITAQYRA
jgi:hypothetical protein